MTEDSGRPNSTEELLQQIDTAWQRIQATIGSLDEAALLVSDAGGWSIKDNLAHLAAWEQIMLRSYLGQEPASVVLGVDEATLHNLDEDGINAIIWRRGSDRPVGEILTESQRSHQEVRDHLATLPFEELLRARFEDDPERRPFLDWVIGNTYDHYDQHAVAIAALAARRAP